MRPLVYIMAVLLLFGCGSENDPSPIVPFEQDDIPLTEKMKKAVDANYIAHLGLPDSAAVYLRNFYAERDYQPLWINDSMLTDLGERMTYVLKKPEQLGVPAGRHKRGSGKNFVQDEILNTYLIAQILPDLQEGIVDFEEKKKRPVRLTDAKQLSDQLKLDPKKDVRVQFLDFGPKDSNYMVLGKGLINLVDTYPMDTTTFKVHTIKKDTAEAIKRATAALISKGYLTEDNDTSKMFAALKVFQIHNGLKPDAVIGKYTSKALNESTAHKRDRIILAMDKIRSRDERPDKYIHINIPEYKLRFYVNDSVKSDHNIVVGKYANQTPELTSKLKKIVAYPYWNVPYSISSKEILPAAKRNSDYFARHNYKVYRKGELVDPLTVNWKGIRQSSFPFKVVQDPGRSNSLGIIKFDFPNSHSVYFHDTPSKALFGADVRAYSHGCMRTQHPVDLAKIILENDYKDPDDQLEALDSLDSIMSRGVHRTIKIADPIPIFVEYTSVARKGQEMITYIDIYGRDEEYLKILTEGNN